jgi:uncharacterized protein (TIGR02099 family)
MRTVSRTLQLFIAALVVIVGLTAASVRVLFPNADRYRGDLESWLSGVAGQPVAIGSLEAEWRGLGPEFRITNLRLRDPAQRGRDGAVNAHFESATVTVDVLASLLDRELRPNRIRMGDVRLRVNRGGRALGPDAALGEDLRALLAWGISQEGLLLDATRVELNDLRVADEALTLTNLHLALENNGDSHVLHATVEIPGMHSSAIRARASIEGDPTTSQWSGDIALDVEELNVATIEAWRYRLGSADIDGRVSFSVDSRWEQGILTAADGDVTLKDMRVASAGGVLGPLDAKARIDLAGSDGDWRLRVLRPGAGFLSFRDPHQLATLRFVGSPLEAGIPRSGESPQSRIMANVTEFDVAAALPLLPMAVEISDDLWQMVLDTSPGGTVRELAVALERNADGTIVSALTGNFDGVGIRGTDGLPDLAGLEGSFEHDATGSRVRFADGGFLASLPEFFPEPIAAQGLHGEVLWSGDSDERRLTLSDVGFFTRDVTARATGEILWEPDESVPFLDLTLGFSDGDLERIEYYIPTSMFGKQTGEWLDRGFPTGRLTAGTVQLRGYPRAEFDTESDFSVTVHTTIHGATVHYLEGWPNAERVSGTVHIADRRLVSDLSEGYFYGARIRPSRFTVADILADDPVFEWTTRIDGRTEDAMRFLRESPLREGFSSLVDNLDAKGRASLAFKLTLPIVTGIPSVSGSVDVAGNVLAVPSLDEGFTDVAGRVNFDQDGMNGEGITGDYLGRTVTAGIETVDDRQGHTRVRLSGIADADYVTKHLHNAGLLASAGPDEMPVLSRLDGAAPWEATVDVLEAGAPGEAPVVLRVESGLEGAAVALPAPFGKTADSTIALAVEARFADADHRRMLLSLGDHASAIFDLRADAGGYRLGRGAVRLGGDTATLPDDARLRVSGNLPHVSLGDWTALVLKPRGAPGASDALPTSVDVAVERLSMLGAEFADVRVSASGNPGGDWRARIEGPEIVGRVLVPNDLPRGRVTAEFERLAWKPIPGALPDTADPREFPPMRVTCAHCSYDGMQMYDVEIVTSRRDDGLNVDTLSLRTDGFRADANGAWVHDAGRGQRTSLDMRLASDDLGKFLASLGHKGGATRGGVTAVTLAASWDGPPSSFRLEDLDGELHFRAGEGTLTDVSRGTTGRLLGLLVVPDLPRRLQGDFSDLFEDGFTYNQIEGNFNIERGNAYTNDLTLDGSQARIEIAGRTGLADEDYDQLITVTPKISENLPLMPIWLVEKAFDQEVLNKLFAYQYTVTGSWDDPAVTLIVIENESPSDRS